MATVRANQTVSVVDPEVPRGRTVVKQDQPFRDDHPLVKAYPWLFGTDDIEQATAAPGEKRSTSRKSK